MQPPNFTQEAVAEQAAGLPRSIALLFAVACGLAVANMYYAHPLLEAIAGEFAIGRAYVGIIVTAGQICYAIGLLLLVPLGDLFDRRKLVAGMMVSSVFGLLAVGAAPNAAVLLAGMAAVGLFAVVVQALVAFAADLAPPEARGRAIGTVTSGVVIGILLARVYAGMLSELAGWRTVYLVSAALMLCMAGVLLKVLPRRTIRAQAAVSYTRLVRSLFVLFAEEPQLRIRAVLCLLIFTAFSILWTSMVLPLSAPPYSLSRTAIGLFGLAGAAGAFAAAKAGRLADRGLGRRTTGWALILLLGSWLLIGQLGHSLPSLVAGVIVLDLAVQAVHVTNQSAILALRPEARSRLTAGYMMFYSIGSAAGSIASTMVYARWGWSGVCLLGASVSAAALLFWAIAGRKRHAA
ncbi:MFS transporter [Paenibacillus thalictri]|uniref:MFS transporter n=1 Tax=Paenibacillus thalictri TaxID=2527873 RepID=A0A4Q9DVE5_9BACL|nr:MFS transporter [Paenibacillus thalictri]TBL79588.1 MFS transporter [Paenibacillus thalictri]